jgi:hypothetical protein
VRIFQNYPLKTRTSKQSIGEIRGYEIISFHLHKYPRSKQSLDVSRRPRRIFLLFFPCYNFIFQFSFFVFLFTAF